MRVTCMSDPQPIQQPPRAIALGGEMYFVLRSGVITMADETERATREKTIVKVKLGDAQECTRAISAAIAKRAYEIYQLRGRGPGRAREDWRLAEKEVVGTLSGCGILDSKHQLEISVLSSALDLKEVEEIQICAESNRVIFIGKERSSALQKQAATVYRVLPLIAEVDPGTISLRRKGCVLEITLQKLHGEPRAQQQRAA
jgi:hypothetical protein